MSDYQTELPVPHAVMGFNGLIEVGTAVGTTDVKSSGPVGKYIKVPSTLPGKPRVTVQAKDAKGDNNGPCFCFDYEADQGRGVWVIFDPKIHEVPEIEVNAALSDPEPEDVPKGRSLDMSASSSVSYDQSADAPKDYCDDDCDGDDVEKGNPRGY